MRTIGAIVVASCLFTFVLGATGGEAVAAEPHMIIITDGDALYLVNDRNPSKRIRLTSPLQRSDMYFEYPSIGAGWIWYDKTEIGGWHGQRLGRTRWINGYSCGQTTRDPWGFSSDTMPAVSNFGSGCLYLTNRKGPFNLELDGDGIMGPGYGHFVSGWGIACWGLTQADKYLAYVAAGYDDDGVYVWDRRKSSITATTPKILYHADGSLSLRAERISVTTDRCLLVSDGWQMYYLVPDQDAITLEPTGVSEATISQDGTKILYVTNSPNSGERLVSSATINQAGELSNTQQMVAVSSTNRQFYSCWPTWCPDSMVFSCSRVSVKLNFAKPNSDSVTLSGLVMVPENVIYNVANVSFGGFTKSFYLKQKDSLLYLPSPPFKGVPKTRLWSVTCSGGSFAAALAGDGFVNSTVKAKSFPLDLTIVFSSNVPDPVTGIIPVGDSYTVTLPLKYTARENYSGTATE